MNKVAENVVLKGEGMMSKKKNLVAYIDTENISYRKVNVILGKIDMQGVKDEIKAYGLRKDPHTKKWADKARKHNLKDIRLVGARKKNMVDDKIKKDAKKSIEKNKSIDIVCIVSSDAGYVETIKEIRANGKRVVVIGEEKAPKALRESCSEFIEV